SRCRELRLSALGPQDMGLALHQALGHDEDSAELAELSGGSVGEAVRLLAGGGVDLYAAIVALLAAIPRISRPDLLKMCNSLVGKDSDIRFDLTVRLVDLALARLARTGATGTPPIEAAPGEARVLARLSPDARAARIWAEQASELGARARGGRAVNLDPGALVLDMFLRLESAARMAAG
ncbi:MAG: DNA polymerase III subunit delta', partial [Rhodobacteraceae bacterium]|nr:DNA polymerase III subunit delta' [Paracoccaceae bacterium]